MRLIDADDLKYQMFGEGSQTKWNNEQIAQTIDNQPTAFNTSEAKDILKNELDEILYDRCYGYQHAAGMKDVEKLLEKVFEGGGQGE